PNLYDGSVIGKSDAIVVPDSENTLMHAKESRSKMLAKQNDPELIEKKVITKPIDYATLNQLSTDFNTRFVPQTESYAEQAFWSQYSVQTDEPNHSVSEVQKILKQMEMAIEQHCVEKSEFQTKMENVLKENNHLLTHALGVEIVNIVVNDCMNVNCLTVSLELNNQLNTEIFQRDTVSSSESALTFAELFETNELKAQIQEKDTVILKLKEKIKSSSADDKERKVENKVEDIKTQNLELDHRVTKLTAKNNHLK
nr:hypothetical protein [Tanacetum cinerariifolium]